MSSTYPLFILCAFLLAALAARCPEAQFILSMARIAAHSDTPRQFAAACRLAWLVLRLGPLEREAVRRGLERSV